MGLGQRHPCRDLGRAHRLVHQLLVSRPRPCRFDRAAGGATRASAKSPLLVTPGSKRVPATIERDGLLADLEPIGAAVLANACGPCIGQWERSDPSPGKPNTIVNSFNRNFPMRNDGNGNTKAFVTSPDMVVAYALAGSLDFNPLVDALKSDSGVSVRPDPPIGEALPPRGFEPGAAGFVAPPADASRVEVLVSPTSDRLQLLTPFPAWDGEEYLDLPVLLKAHGKCSTDHFSAAGRWLTDRGHLESISGNLFLGVRNAYTGAVGEGRDPIDGETKSFPDIAKHLANEGMLRCAVGDENYGEGSSREHAAMGRLYRGGVAIFARCFARIHETNLKDKACFLSPSRTTRRTT